MCLPVARPANRIRRNARSAADGHERRQQRRVLDPDHRPDVHPRLDRRTRPDLDLQRAASPTADLTIEIRDGSLAGPGDTVFATRTFPASSVSTAPGAPLTVTFSPAVPVVAGTHYAIVAYSATSALEPYQWRFSISNPYMGGGFFTSSTAPPTTWTSVLGLDAAFKTYVVVGSTSPTGQPGSSTAPTGRRSAALAKCKRKEGAKRKRCRKRAKKLPV
jgi:hypothetical protein